jgi:thiol-disulfide isomerase/thioredoxin
MNPRRLALLMAAAVLGMAAPAGYAQRSLVGESAHNFTLKDVHGRSVSLKESRGKVVVLDFWAVWCGPCVKSVPFFQQMADKYGERGLEVIGLHVDDRMPPAQEIKEYLEDRSIRYTNLLSTVEVDEEYAILAMPTTYFVDRKGRIASQHLGFNPAKTPATIEAEIKNLLGKK